MARKRIHVAFADKGFVDPLIAQCAQQLTKAKDTFGLTFEQLFGIFDGEKVGLLTKESFLICVQGLELDTAVEDLMELFNHMDSKHDNTADHRQTLKVGSNELILFDEQALFSFSIL